MTDVKDSIRSAIQNLIKDNATAAELDMHPVFTAKIKQAAGITSTEEEVATIEDDTDSEGEE